MNYEIESALKLKGFTAICGIDEAGCGPLAGPVSAAAVILNDEDPIEGLDDSKKLTHKKREELFSQITSRVRAYGIAFASVEEIEEMNILQARLLAMRRACSKLLIPPDIALVDGNRNPMLDIPTQLITHGDALSPSIAAASILAKVSRDRLMLELAEQYPEYGFEIHKGYATKLHRERILEFGPCDIHRMSFLKNLLGAKR